jgi:hypothetical protein
MTRPLTAQIKPSTKHALMDQLALAADVIIELRGAQSHHASLEHVIAMFDEPAPAPTARSGQFWLGVWMTFAGIVGFALVAAGAIRWWLA